MALWQNSYFLFLWVVSISTALAIGLFTVTILVAVFEQTGSTVQAAGTTVAQTFSATLRPKASSFFKVSHSILIPWKTILPCHLAIFSNISPPCGIIRTL